MSDQQNLVQISPQAIAEAEMAIRQALEAKHIAMERRLLFEIDKRIRLEVELQRKQAEIAHLKELMVEAGVSFEEEGKPNGDT